MTQFPQDISLNTALSLLKDVTPARNRSEDIALEHALGRVLAEDVIAAINVPQQDTAAVDGYGFYHDDLKSTSAPPIMDMPIIGNIKAGHPFEGIAARGNAYRIFTGAPMPDGPDTVAMQEDCTLNDNDVRLPTGLSLGVNLRKAGENVAAGTVVLTKGTRLGAAEIGLAAAIGRAELRVACRLTVAIISIGDELAEVGATAGLNTGMIYDSNRPMLCHLMRADGHHVLDLGIIPDDLDALVAAYGRAAKDADVIISSGGSSEGDEDHAKSSILNNNGVIDFWRLAIKPGRPIAAGRIGETHIYCVPGNPVAAFVCTRLLVAPMLMRQLGGHDTPPIRINLPSGFSRSHRKGRTEYLRARLEHGVIMLSGRSGAGVLSSLTAADGLVEIPAEHDDIHTGDLLPFILFREHGL